MKKLISMLAISLLAMGLLAMPVNAATFKSAETLIVDQPINDDYYIAGGEVIVDADVNGDLFVAGGNITINGNVLGDLMIAGGQVTVKGNVGDDIRMIGGQLSIYGSTKGDVLTSGGQLNIEKGAIIGGSLVTGSGSAVIDGEIQKDILGAVGSMRLNGKVGRNVEVAVDKIFMVSEKAVVTGNLKYTALQDMKVPKQAVKGKIEFNKVDFNKEEAAEGIAGAYVGYKAASYLAALFIVLLLTIFCSNMLVKSVEQVKKNVLKTFGIGLVTMILGFVGSLILMVTLIGIPVGLMLLVLLFMATYLSKIFVATWLASYLMDFKKTNAKRFRLKLFFAIAGALLAYYIVCAIPVLGWMLNAILFMIGIGSMVMVKKEGFMILRSKKMV
jgi:hypothetical protein